MDSDRLARLAVAGPVMIVAGYVAMAVGAAASNVASWMLPVLAAILPLGFAAWVVRPTTARCRLVFPLVALVAAAACVAAIAFIISPLFLVRGTGISEAGVYAYAYGAPAIIAIGSVLARYKSGAAIVGSWLIWWAAAVAGVVFAERATYVLTDLAGADAIAGTIGYLFAPSLALAAWVGVLVAVSTWGRWDRREVHVDDTRLSPDAIG